MRCLVLLIGLAAVAAMTGPNIPDFVDDPTEPTLGDVSGATYGEFDRSKKARCGGSPLGAAKSCWKDLDGAVFRYGCIAGDSRIFTDSCGSGDGCDDSKCDNRWKWGGEQQATCYDDGQKLYQFSCDDATAVAPVPLKPTDAPVAEPSSCVELGWPLQPGDLSVCGFSKVNNGACANGNFNVAQDICASAGARLCTAQELANDETKNTGCKGDCAEVWSSSECVTSSGAAGHVTLAGATKCLNKFPETCQANGTPDKVVRCCADVNKAVSLEDSYPQGFSPAIARDYKLSDGGCGVSAPIGRYSCWTNSDGVSMRFACSGDDQFIYVQFCGSDSDCSPNNCYGDWQQTEELMGQCYNRESEGYLFHYHCPNKL